jgi:hypothetical protein
MTRRQRILHANVWPILAALVALLFVAAMLVGDGGRTP